MSSYYILEAHKELIKEYGNDYDSHSDGSYASILFNEIADAESYWAYGIKNLINPSYWRISRLLQSDDKMRKPTAYIYSEINKLGNLIVEWFPTKEPYSNPRLQETDWMYWDCYWRAGKPPFNRILTIKEFWVLISPMKPQNKLVAEYNLLRATEQVLSNVYFFLGGVIDFEIISNLYVEFGEGKKSKQLVSCKIRNVQEVEQEKAAHEKLKWLGTIPEKIQMSPEQFLELVKSLGMSYWKTAKELSAHGCSISYCRVKSMVEKLYEYPEIYDKIIEVPPKGLPSRKITSKVINVDFKKST